MQNHPLWWRLMCVALGCFQNMTMGGVFYGWTSISTSVLITAPSNGGAGLSGNYLHAMFVMASFFNFLGPLGLGVILDLYGPRACSVASSLCVVLGSAMFGISSTDKLPLFIPGMCLIAFGGPGVQNAIIHLSNLFPEWKGFTTAIITGAFQLSFFVFYFFDQLWRYAYWDYQQLFLWYALLASVNIVIALVMWPDKPYSFFESDETKLLRHESKASYADLNEIHKQHEPEVMHMGLVRLPSMMYHKAKGGQSGQASPAFRNSPALRSPASISAAATTAARPAKDIKDGTLAQQVRSPPFIQLSVFFIVSAFWANFYIGTMDLQLGDNFSMDPETRSAYGGLFTFIMGMSVLAIPVAGAIMDAAGLPFTSAITILAAVVWVALQLVNEKDTIVASFVFYAVFRTFLFTFFFAQLADTMGFKFFGVLAGIIFAVGGLLGLLQFYLAEWASGTCHALSDKKGIDSAHCDHGQWVTLNALMLSSLLLLLICSYADWARRRKESEGASASGLGSRSGSIEIAERARLTADNNAGDGRDYGSRQSEPSLEF